MQNERLEKINEELRQIMFDKVHQLGTFPTAIPGLMRTGKMIVWSLALMFPPHFARSVQLTSIRFYRSVL